MLKNKILSASGGGVDPIFVDEVFQTHLYTGNSSTQTITNGIDLAGKGGLVWEKNRSIAQDHYLVDSNRPLNDVLRTNTTGTPSSPWGAYSFNANGYSSGINFASGNNIASWTFRKAEKFFDVVTYTGNGTSITVPHSLGSTPGCIIVKRTNATAEWVVYHRSVPSNCGFLNLTNSFASAQRFSSVTSTNFTINVSTADVNASGGTYVAYLFAHDAGGFGATGNDNVISCGGVTTSGNRVATIDIGFEPQWILLKNTNVSTADWLVFDSMRGLVGAAEGQSVRLYPNLTNADDAITNGVYVTPTGFYYDTGIEGGVTGTSFIYIAIRRPMKPPTSGTQVFMPMTSTGTGNARNITGVGFAPDMFLSMRRTSATYSHHITDRLRGASVGSLFPMLTDVENNSVNAVTAFGIDGISFGSGALQSQNAGTTYVYDFFRRAPGFFDEVCYTGTGNGQVINHNLGAVPELAIFKLRAGTGGADWVVRAPGTTTDRFLLLNSTNAQSTAANWYSATSTQITFTTAYAGTAQSGFTYVAYLFASLPGISQVGTYTGNGSSQTINCGFAAGARFVLIRRTDSTGNWVTFDTARGIVSGNDPALYINSNAAEVTGIDGIDPDNSGFIVNQESTFNLNVNGASYIYLSVA